MFAFTNGRGNEVKAGLEIGIFTETARVFYVALYWTVDGTLSKIAQFKVNATLDN